MKYTKIKQGTEAWELVHKIFTYKDAWAANEKRISEFLGFPMDGNIAFEVSNLWADPRTMKKHRPEWEKEFKKSDYEITSTKSASKLKKEWVKLCEELGLETYKARDFSWKYGLIFIGSMEYHKYDDDYFISLESLNYDFSQHDWAEPIEESKFLRIRADHLERKEKSA